MDRTAGDPTRAAMLLAVATTEAVTIQAWNAGQWLAQPTTATTHKPDLGLVADIRPFTKRPREFSDVKLTDELRMVRCVAWGHDGQVLAVGGNAPWLEIYRWDGTLLETIPVNKASESADGYAVNCLEFASESRTIVFSGTTRTVRRWDRHAKCISQSFQSHKTAVTALALSGDKSLVASGSKRGDIVLYNRKNGTKTELKFGSRHPINALCFSPRHKHTLAAISEDGTVGVWETLRSPTPVKLFSRAHSAPGKGLRFNPYAPAQLYSTGFDQTIVQYDLSRRAIVKAIPTAHPLTSFAILSDGHQLLVGTLAGQLLLYDPRIPQKPLWTSPAPTQPAPIVATELCTEAKLDPAQLAQALQAAQALSSPSTLPTVPAPAPIPALQSAPQAISPTEMPTTPRAMVTATSNTNGSLDTAPMATPRSSTEALADMSAIVKDRSYMDLFSPIGKPTASAAATKATPTHQLTTPEITVAASPKKDDRAPPTTATPPPPSHTLIMPKSALKQTSATRLGAESNVLRTNSKAGTRKVSFGFDQAVAEPHRGQSGETSPTLSAGSSASVDKQPLSPTLADTVSGTNEYQTQFTDGDSTPFKSTGNRPMAQALLGGDTQAAAENASPPSRNGLPPIMPNRTTPASLRRSAFKSKMHHHFSKASPLRSSNAVNHRLANFTPSPTGKSHRKVLFATQAPTAQPQTSHLHATATTSHPQNSTNTIGTTITPPPPESRALHGIHSMLPAGHTDTASTLGNGLDTIQHQVLKNLITECLSDFRRTVHEDVRNMHIDMIRQFQDQETLLERLFDDYTQFDAMKQELARLREENKLLKRELGYE
ncbi:hypothetical protein H4R34_004034 [Dimargaris verticillata]|uniref:WD40-repeat-containing domain protein n=1 Tax=Dimargaris verticillata TaxID=2761393 RepID=A0A9W8B6D1_9FUNG|nr:hypothetical protein H4R34_004034 [Dimargaris verticillata]